MDQNTANKILMVVIPTIDEVDYAPESVLYLGLQPLGVSLDDWMVIKNILVTAKLATAENNTLRITPAGHAMAEKINIAMGKVQPENPYPSRPSKKDWDYDPDMHLGKPVDPATERRLQGY